MNQLNIQRFDGEARADSREIAQALGNQHKNVLSLLDDYLEQFEELGRVAFETRTLETSGGRQKIRVAYLNENQCYFLLTLVRNSERVVALKLALVKAFAEARVLLSQPVAPVLPTDPLDLLALSLQAQQQQRQQIAAIEERLDNAPIRANSELRARIHTACQQFGRVHPRGYSGAYRAFKEAFGYAGAALASYDDLPQSRVADALAWLDAQIRVYGATRLEGLNA